MTLDSTSIKPVKVIQSGTEPPDPAAGTLWVDVSGNNTEYQFWTGSTWETLIARGPDNPGYEVEGTLWRDTGAGSLKVYDGSAFDGLGNKLKGGLLYRQNSDQSIPSGSTTKVNWNGELFDTNGNMDLANAKYVVPEAGLYVAYSNVTYRNDTGWSTGDRMEAQIHVNGSVESTGRSPKTGTGFESAQVLYLAQLSSGDDIEVVTRQDSGSSKNVFGPGSGSNGPQFFVARIG